jgi:hypothetical protein
MRDDSEERAGESERGRDTLAPPQAPPLRRRLSLTRKQWIGLPLIAAVPVLTLLGVFGERGRVARASSPTLDVIVRYPERFRYRQIQALEVTVRNRSGRVLDTVHVSLDTAYITRFSSVRIDPPTTTSFVIDFAHVEPNEARLVAAELWGQDYGRHRGRILAWSGHDSAGVTIQTIVFP